MTKKFVLTTLPFLAIGGLVGLTGCNEKYDAKLVVYNWEDYIYDGTDDDGYVVDDSVVERFEKYYKEKTGLKVKVEYECFSTNEIMYQQITLGAIKPDLICPSDYMIQKMANAGLLEEFSYDELNDTYGESLKNWDEYGSPYIRNRFAQETLSNGSSFLKYAVPYFWGTMGFTYDSEYFTADEVETWECLWNNDAKFAKKFTLKDSMRDSYVAAIFHVYRNEITALDVNAADYNDKLSAIFNRCDDETITKVENALKATKANVFGFEVDEGKDGIVQGTYKANLAWSGDSVYSMDSAEESGKTLNYALPQEGSNVWFDGWCMPKGANKELAEEFVNFMCAPSTAQLCMEAVGYTSPIVGDEIWQYVAETYAADDEETDYYEADLSFFFGGEHAKIRIANSEKGRQFDAQYPTEQMLKRCCMMKDFGENTSKVDAMWARVKSAFN